MKHLKKFWNNLCFHVSRIQISLIKVIWPQRALLIKREGERALLIDQLTRSIEVNEVYRKERGRRGGSFAKNSARLQLQKAFLLDIKKCPIEEFEEVASKWMSRTRALQ